MTTIAPRPLSIARSTRLRARFRCVRSVFSDVEIRRVLDRATAHEHATLAYTVRHVRLLEAARRHLGSRIALCTRTYPEHDTVVYWLESR